MKIIITGNFFFPTGMAASARIRNLASGLIEAGCEKVYIIAASPPIDDVNYPIQNWIKFKDGIHCYFATGSTNKLFKSDRIKKRIILLKSVTSTKKAIQELTKREEIGGIFLYGRSYFTFRSILKLAQNKSIPTMLDVVELPTLNKGFHEFFIHPFTIDSYWSYKKSAKEVDFLAFITNGLRSLYNHTSCKKYLLPSIEKWEVVLKNIPQSNEQFTFSYVGALIEKDAPDKLLPLLELLCTKNVDFRIKIIGRYDRYSEGRKWKKKLSETEKIKEKIIWVGEVNDQELENQLFSSDGLILLRQNRSIEEFSFPTRLVEYLKTSRPVFVTNKGDIPLYLEHMESAFFIHPTNLENSIDELIELMMDSSLCREIGRNGFMVGQKQFNRVFHAQRIIELFKGFKALKT